MGLQPRHRETRGRLLTRGERTKSSFLLGGVGEQFNPLAMDGHIAVCEEGLDLHNHHVGREEKKEE